VLAACEQLHRALCEVGQRAVAIHGVVERKGVDGRDLEEAADRFDGVQAIEVVRGRDGDFLTPAAAADAASLRHDVRLFGVVPQAEVAVLKRRGAAALATCSDRLTGPGDHLRPLQHVGGATRLDPHHLAIVCAGFRGDTVTSHRQGGCCYGRTPCTEAAR